MMTFAKIKNGGKYYLDLAREDYYLNGGEPDGVWGGSASSALGLKSLVEGDDFKNILQGLSPCGKFKLCQTSGETHTPGWDLTFNAPKSLSVLWAAADDKLRQEIQKAQLRAVREAVSLLEANAAFTRRSSGGKKKEQTEGLVVAFFEHSTSRELDPHLHTHAIVANVAPRADGTWGTVDSRSIMLWQKAAGMTYKISLAESLRELGFQTSPDGDAFKIDGVPQQVCDYFSKRSKQIIEVLNDRNVKKRASTSGDVASLSTRNKKGDINRSELFSSWKSELVGFGVDQQTITALRNFKRPIQFGEAICSDTLAAELTSTNAVFTQQDIYFHGGLKALENNTSLKSLRAIVNELQVDGNTVDLGCDWRNSQIYTTREVIETEKALIVNAKKLSSSQWCGISEQIIEQCIRTQKFELSDEQQFAVRNACSDRQIAIIQGSAGAGKSASMRCVRDIYRASGKRVVGAAIARSAANNLGNEAGIETYTIAGLLAWLETAKPPVTKGDVLIIDEAGQVGTRDIEQLMGFASQNGFKVILVGEDKQLDAIEHGGILRYLSSPDVIGATRVKTIRRQSQIWDRQAVAAFRDGYAQQALIQYQKRGQLHIEKNEPSTKFALVDAWTRYRQQNPHNQSMVIAHSWTDVVQLNNEMRSQLQRENLLGNENIFVPATVSDRDIDIHLSLGEKVRFTQNDYSRNYTNGDLGTVTKLEVLPDGDIWIRVKLDSGRETQFKASTYSNERGRVYLTQAYAQTVYSAQGLTINGDVFVYYTSGMDRAHSYVACSRHRDAAHIFVNKQEFEADIPSDFKNAPQHIALREAVARNMSRDLRPKLASEYLPIAETHKIQTLRQTGHKVSI